MPLFGARRGIIGAGRTAVKTLPPGIYKRVASGARQSLPANFFQTYPWLAGFVVFDFWNLFEVAEHTYDFSYFDAQLARARTDRKPVIFQLKTGGDPAPSTAIPSWIKGTPYNRPVHYRSDITEHGVCPWDSVVRAKAMTAMRILANRYDNEPLVVGVALCGVNWQYNEMLLPLASSFVTPSIRTVADNPLLIDATTINANLGLAAWPSSGGFRLESEDVTYSGKSGAKFTGITRGVNGTTAVQHALGTSIAKYNPWATEVGDPPNAIYSAIAYSDAWNAAILSISQAWPRTPVVVMLEAVAGDNDVFGWDNTLSQERGVLAYVDASSVLVKHVYYGTATLGDTQQWTPPIASKFARLRTVPVRPSTGEPYPPARLAKIFYEIGNDNLSADSGITEAIRRAKVDCGATAIMISDATWTRSDTVKDLIRAASMDYWGI